MQKKASKNIKLGLFVTAGILIFIAVVYFVGANQSLFGSTTTINTVFKNVSGLQVGNNVRYAGINVGTVERISLVSDSTVRVTFVVNNDAAQFIKKDSEATIASEGLMGNKVLSISSGSAGGESVSDNDQIPGAEPVEIEDIIADLKVTANHAKGISGDIEEISSMIKKGEGTVGRLLTDPALVNSFDRMIYTLQKSGDNALEITNDFAEITQSTKQGEGALGKLLVDETLAIRLESMLDSLQEAGNNAALLSDRLIEFSNKLNNTEGALGKLLTDTAMAKDMHQTLLNVKAGSDDLEETIQKVNNSWLLNLFGGKDKEEEKKQKKKKKEAKVMQ